MKSKNFKFRSISTLINILVVTSAILLNLIINIVSEKHQLRLDLTNDKKFEISSEYINYLKNLQKDIKIDILASLNQLKSNEFGIQVKEILNQYQNLSEKINVDFVDIEKNPNYASKFSKENLEFLDIIISHGENYYILKYSELFETRPSSDGNSYIVVSSKAEQEIISTILNISEDRKPKVSFLRGYDEEDVDEFEMLLKKNGYDVKKTTISNSEIPSDSDVVVIMGPHRDYTKESIEKLEKFLKNEENSIKNLIYVANPEAKSVQNLEDFVEKYGIKIKNGTVFENNPSFIGASGDPYSFFLSYVDQEYTKGIKSTKINVYTGISKAIDVENRNKVKILLQSSKESGIRPNDAPKDWNFTPEKLVGPIPIAVYTQVGREEDNYNKNHSKIFVFGTHIMFDENILNSTKTNNTEYLLNVFKILTENETNKISIKPKSMENKELGVTYKEANMIFFILVVLIPILILGICLAVLFRRRNR